MAGGGAAGSSSRVDLMAHTLEHVSASSFALATAYSAGGSLELSWRLVVDAGSRSAASRWMSAIAAMQQTPGQLKRALSRAPAAAEAAASPSRSARQLQVRVRASLPEVRLVVLAAQLAPPSDASSPRSPRSPRSVPSDALAAAASPPLLELGVRGLKAELSQRMCDTKASLTLGEIVLAAHPPAGRVPLLVGRGEGREGGEGGEGREGGEGGEGGEAALFVLHAMLVRPGSPEYAAAVAEAALTGAVQAVRLYLVPAALQAVG